MTIREQLSLFFDDPAGMALQLMLLVALADFVLGVAAAFRDNTFQLDAVGAWLRKHIAGRVLPIGFLLAIGYFGGVAAFLGLGLAGATLYAAETIGSITSSWGSKRERQPVPED